MPPTWYLSADFQMYILSPFFVYAIYKYGTKGYVMTVAVILASAFYSYSISIDKRFVSRELDM